MLKGPHVQAYCYNTIQCRLTSISFNEMKRQAIEPINTFSHLHSVFNSIKPLSFHSHWRSEWRNEGCLNESLRLPPLRVFHSFNFGKLNWIEITCCALSSHFAYAHGALFGCIHSFNFTYVSLITFIPNFHIHYGLLHSHLITFVAHSSFPSLCGYYNSTR